MRLPMRSPKRSIRLAAIVCALVLAACSSAPTPTATLVPPTAEPTNPVTSDDALATLAATVGAPQRGTLAVSDSETPNAPTRAPIVIDSLYYTQSGGIAGISLAIELRGDGTLIRDGETSTVSSEDLQQISTLLDSIRFFEIQGIFTGPSGAADTYRYSLTVNAPNGSRTIMSEDGMTPPELYQLYEALRGLNQSS